jgi:hypothetical protein
MHEQERDKMGKRERNKLKEIIENEGIHYGLTCYMNIAEEFSDVELLLACRNYLHASIEISKLVGFSVDNELVSIKEINDKISFVTAGHIPSRE